MRELFFSLWYSCLKHAKKDQLQFAASNFSVALFSFCLGFPMAEWQQYKLASRGSTRISCWVFYVELLFNQINQTQSNTSRYIPNIQPDFHIIGEKHCRLLLLTELNLKEEATSAENEGSCWMLQRAPTPLNFCHWISPDV